MPTTKEIVSRLSQLAAGTMHADIDRSTLFQDAAAEIERLDKALYEEKEKTRRLTFTANMLSGYLFGTRDKADNAASAKHSEQHHIDPDSPLMTE